MDANNGASSAPVIEQKTTEQALADRDVSAYFAAENAREKAAEPPKPAAPAPAAEVEAKPAEELAAPAPANEKPIQEKKAPKGAEERKAELGAEIQDLLKKRAELRAELEGKAPAAAAKPGEKAADPSPAAAAKPEAPKKPALADFKTYAEYDAANEAYIEQLVTFKAEQVLSANLAKQAEQAANKERETVWNSQVAAAKEEHADFAEVAFSADTPITQVMDGFILDSQHGARVLYELGKNGSAEGKRIAALPPIAAMRALVAIESSLSTKKEPPAPVKTKTAAPPPATDLNAKNSQPADEVEAALASGDVAAYMAAANARDRKQHARA